MEVFEKLKIKKFIPALIIFGLLLFITSYHTSSLIQDNNTQSKEFGNGNTWECQKNNIVISGDGNDIKSINVEHGSNESLYTGDKVVVFDYNITSTDTVSGNFTIAISDVGIMSDDTSLEIWRVSDNYIKQISSDTHISEGNVEFSASELGEYIAVSNVATVDLAKGAVTVTNYSLTGVRQDTQSVTVPLDVQDIKYRISQSNNETKVNNIIKKAKESGKITYGELATELTDANPDQIDKVFDAFEEMGVNLLSDDIDDEEPDIEDLKEVEDNSIFLLLASIFESVLIIILCFSIVFNIPDIVDLLRFSTFSKSL